MRSCKLLMYLQTVFWGSDGGFSSQDKHGYVAITNSTLISLADTIKLILCVYSL